MLVKIAHRYLYMYFILCHMEFTCLESILKKIYARDIGPGFLQLSFIIMVQDHFVFSTEVFLRRLAEVEKILY